MLPLCSRVPAEPIAGTLAGLQPFAPKCRALARGFALAARMCILVRAAATYGGARMDFYVFRPPTQSRVVTDRSDSKAPESARSGRRRGLCDHPSGAQASPPGLTSARRNLAGNRSGNDVLAEAALTRSCRSTPPVTAGAARFRTAYKTGALPAELLRRDRREGARQL